MIMCFLKTVICLVPELPIHDLTSFCGEPGTPNAVNIIHIPVLCTFTHPFRYLTY